MAQTFTKCECGETVRKLRLDDETLRKLGGHTIEIGLDVIHVGASPQYSFQPIMGYAFQATEDGTVRLVEALDLHRCPRRR